MVRIMRNDTTSQDQRGARAALIDPSVCATVSLAEAALVLGVHRSTAWDLHKRGVFPVPVLQIGHRLRVTKVHLERYLMGPLAEPSAGAEGGSGGGR